jgi:spore maturation protein CgeB
MRIYIKEHPFGAGKWIYKGYESAWRHLGFEVKLYKDLLEIQDTDYDLMAIDYDVRSEEHVEALRRAKRAYLYVQPNRFPSPWGAHPNFVSQVSASLLTPLNQSIGIFKWSFAETEGSQFYSGWNQVNYVPLAFDSINYKDLSSDKYSFDVCYVGGWANNGFNEKQKIILEHLSAFKESGLRCGFAVNRGISHEQENKLISNSRVAINIHDAYQHALGLDTNERTFKSLGLCGIIVSDKVDCLPNLFPDIQMARSPKEMVDMVRQVCDMPDDLLLQEKMKNRNNILSNHTYIQRAKKLLSLNNEP